MGLRWRLRGIVMFLDVDWAKRQPDGRRAAEAPLLSRVRNCASVGKYSQTQRLKVFVASVPRNGLLMMVR